VECQLPVVPVGPVERSALPLSSTSAQSVADAQETSCWRLEYVLIETGALQTGVASSGSVLVITLPKSSIATHSSLGAATQETPLSAFVSSNPSVVVQVGLAELGFMVASDAPSATPTQSVLDGQATYAAPAGWGV